MDQLTWDVCQSSAVLVAPLFLAPRRYLYNLQTLLCLSSLCRCPLGVPGKTPFVNARKNTVDYSHADDEFDHEKAVEIEAVHEGDPHAGLYGRIVGWKGCREGLFGEGTRGENFPDNAQDVVLAMLRPEAYDRLESRDVLNMAWLALPGYESVDSSSVNPK